MKRKLIMLVLALMSAAAVMTSCLLIPGGNEGGGDQEPDGEISYGFFIKSSRDDTDYTELLASLKDALGYSLTVYNDSGTPVGSEILMGDLDRDITDKAKQALAAELDKVELVSDKDTAGGYVIYAEGDSLTVYWSIDYAKDAALKSLVTLLGDKNAEINDGAVVMDAYSLLVRANEDKVVDDARKWAAIEAVSPETAAALRDALEFYEIERIYQFYGELWDPSTGAFYYSKTARDYEGFLPDIESTSQILRFIRGYGFLTGYDGPMAAYPEEMQKAIVAFTQGLQSPDDGYFYHPQWGTDLTTQRLGRDQNNSLVVLTMFGAKPLYSTGSDRLEGSFDEDDYEVAYYTSDTPITKPLGGSTVVAVSKVIAVAESDSRFESLDAFMEWVHKTMDGRTSHTFGHAFSSSGRQINAAGYMDELLDLLDDLQAQIFEEQMTAHLADPENNPEPSGLWEPAKDYTSLSGCFKIVGMYNSYHREIDEKYIPYMVKAGIVAINIPESAHHTGEYPLKQMVYIYNPWAGLGRVFINMNKYNPELYDDMVALMRVNAPDMVYNTVKKLNLFRKSDGSFSYFIEGAAATTQGVPVALGLPDEGDVNATGLAFGMYQDMFETLGYEFVAPYDNTDFDEFIEICQSMLAPKKIGLTSDKPYDYNSVPYALTTSLQNGETDIIDDPVGYNGSVYSFTTVAGTSDSVYIKTHGNYMQYNCYVFESDLCIYETDGNAVPFSIRMGSKKSQDLTYRLDLTVSGGNVSAVDNSADKKKTPIGISAKVGEWFNLRIEYYVDDTTAHIKIYQDGRLVGTSTNFNGSHEGTAPVNVYEYAQIYGMKKTDSTLLIDNTVCVGITKPFVEELVINSYDFEDGRLISPTDAGHKSEIVKDPSDPANKMLAISSTDTSKTVVGYLNASLTDASPDSCEKKVSFDVHIPSVDNDGDGVYNEIAGDLLHATDNATKIIFKCGVYIGGSESLRLVALANGSGVSSSYKLQLWDLSDNLVITLTESLQYDTTYSIDTVFDVYDGVNVGVSVDGEELVWGDYVLSTVPEGNGEAVINYENNGAVMLKFAFAKRFVGTVYLDNIDVEFSEDLVEEQ